MKKNLYILLLVVFMLNTGLCRGQQAAAYSLSVKYVSYNSSQWFVPVVVGWLWQYLYNLVYNAGWQYNPFTMAQEPMPTPGGGINTARKRMQRKEAYTYILPKPY